MVQTASFAVLTAIAFGAVSVAAVPVNPNGAAQAVQRVPVQPAARPFGPGPQRLDTPRPVVGAQRLENPARPGPAGQRLDRQPRPEPAGSSLKSQNQAIHNMEEKYASTDRKKAQGFETEYKADEAKFKAYEAEAQRLDPTTGRTATKKARRTVLKASTPPPARPAANNNVAAVARPNVPSRPVAPGSTRPAANGKPSTQQQLLSTQRTTLQNEKQKFANQDTAEAKKFQSEADAYRAEAQRLEPSRKPAPPQTYQQSLAAQNTDIQRLENKFAAEDRRPATAPRDLDDEAEFFARLDWEEAEAREFEDDMEEFAREWDEYELRAVDSAMASPEMAESATQDSMAAPAAPPAPHHHHKKGKGKGRGSRKSMRDFEDDVEEFAREWDEYELRAVDPTMATPDMAEGATQDSMAAPAAPPAPHPHHHKKGKGKGRSSKKSMRDFEDDVEAVAREWAVLEELD